MTPTWFLLVVLALGVFADARGTMRNLLVLCLFGATAAVELTALGGAPVLPAVAFLPFVLFRAWSERSRTARRFPAAGFWLLATVGWAIVSAFLLPRLLAGSVAIKTFDRGGSENAVTVPLRPVSGNVTQSAYAVIDALVFFSMRSLLARRGRAEDFARAVLLLAAINCFAAVLGLAEYYAGLPKVLEALRNAKYTIYDTYELGGLARVQGTFPEASMFAMFSLPLFAFTSSLWFSRWHGTASGALAATTLALLLVSTSGTAYVGLAAYGSCVALGMTLRMLLHGSMPRAQALAVAACVVTIALCLVVLSSPEPIRYATHFLDTAVFRKMTSVSGVDRSAANALAWTDFVDTHGLGVGLGSTRASSFALVLVSNLGILGVVAFGAFILHVLGSKERGDTVVAIVARASRQAVLAGLIGACIAGNVFELGVAFYCFAAAATLTTRDVEPQRGLATAPSSYGFA